MLGLARYSGARWRNVQVRFLEHVRRVQPALEPAIESELDHPFQPRAETRVQIQKRGFIPALDAPLQLDQLAGIIGHDRFHGKITAQPARLSTRFLGGS